MCGLTEVSQVGDSVRFRSGCGRQCKGPFRCHHNSFETLAESEKVDMPYLTDSEEEETGPKAEASETSESEMERDLIYILIDCKSEQFWKWAWASTREWWTQKSFTTR